MYIILHVKYPLFLSDFNESGIFSMYFRKINNIKFYKIPSSGSRVFLCRKTDRHYKVIVAFRNFMAAC